MDGAVRGGTKLFKMKARKMEKNVLLYSSLSYDPVFTFTFNDLCRKMRRRSFTFSSLLTSSFLSTLPSFNP